MVPTDRRYTKDHEWVVVEGDTATVGITDFAQGELGDIVFVEAPEAGKPVERGDVIGTIESVKAVSEIFAPLSGTIADTNASLDTQPELINQDPHAAGWYCKIRVADPAELSDLLEAPAYDALIGS